MELAIFGVIGCIIFVGGWALIHYAIFGSYQNNEPDDNEEN